MPENSQFMKEKSFFLENNFPHSGSWYIFYTRPKSEKVVYHELRKMNYVVFLPTIKRESVWKNRQKKIIEEVLLPGYIFVQTTINELYKILRIPKIVTYIQCGGKPSVVMHYEIERIRNIIVTEKDISIDSDFSKEEKVKIISGPFSGYEGIIVKKNGKSRFGMLINGINCAISIEISPQFLKKI
jgi:transcription antitermination factor NusG